MPRVPCKERSPLFVEAVRTKHPGCCPTTNGSPAPPLAPVTDITIAPNAVRKEVWTLGTIGIRLAFDDSAVFSRVLRGLRLDVYVGERQLLSIPAWAFLDEHTTMDENTVMLHVQVPPLEVLARAAKAAQESIPFGICRFHLLNTRRIVVPSPYSLRSSFVLDSSTYNSVLGYERAERPWQMGAGFAGSRVIDVL